MSIQSSLSMTARFLVEYRLERKKMSNRYFGSYYYRSYKTDP
jgi:hypothetical protein